MNRRNCPFVPAVIGCCALCILLLASPQGNAQVSQQQKVTKFVHELKSADPKVCRSAAAALGKIGAPAVPALIKMLKETNPGVRTYTADALGQIGAPAASAVPALIVMLKDTELSVRRNAADALKRIKGL